MAFAELLFVSVGAAVVLFYGSKLLSLVKMAFARMWSPLPNSFFTSLGQWAVISGGSDGIGKAYAVELAKHGMDIVLMSRTLWKLEKAAQEIGALTGQRVKIITADFTKDDIYEHIMESLRGLEVGVLVNNVGMLPSAKACLFLEQEDLAQKITDLINCNVKSLTEMCRVVLPGMEKRKRGLILNISSGVAYVPWPMYSIYGASKVFAERFSRGLQAEYKAKGIIIQTVTPFGVSTAMSGYQEPNLVTFTAEEFVRTSLNYVMTGDHTYGSISHWILGSIIGNIPKKIFHSDVMQEKMEAYINRRVRTQAHKNDI
ncbi:17-beta-hydroxysteroid dehydrogenase type 3 [Scleropages formosus]|uniref:Hydroxysteroid (17-beta) dehydrogenase 3 n=1 Tax=Scleropages formosus TaxID=113540 RepID=A0A8C9R9P2_SCLFO|nr:testosterone 17-beta-dehydrogenase 3 [Scleropages formosus]